MTLILALRYWYYIAIALLVIALSLSISRCSSNASEIDAVKAKYELTLITEQAEYLAKINDIERANNERWQNAVNQNAQTQKQIAHEYANTSAIVDSLSDTIDKNNAAYLKASADARAKYTIALSNVSKDCISEITQLSRIADGHVADIRMMQQAWPKN